MRSSTPLTRTGRTTEKLWPSSLQGQNLTRGSGIVGAKYAFRLVFHPKVVGIRVQLVFVEGMGRVVGGLDHVGHHEWGGRNCEIRHTPGWDFHHAIPIRKQRTQYLCGTFRGTLARLNIFCTTSLLKQERGLLLLGNGEGILLGRAERHIFGWPFCPAHALWEHFPLPRPTTGSEKRSLKVP